MITATCYITTRTDTQLFGCPSVVVDSVHTSRAAARKAQERASVSVLPVWDGQLGRPSRRRAPRAGDLLGTYRDGSTLYVVAPEVQS